MQSIITNYTFIPASKQIDFSSYSGFDIQKLKAVINITTNQLIYQSGNPTYGYSSFALNVLTLVFDTTAMNDSDLLQIYYDTANGDNSLSNIDSNIGAKVDSVASSDTGTFSLIALFKRLLQGVTSLISNTGNIPTNGQKTNANSLPIVISTEQAQDKFIVGAASQSALGNNIFLDITGSSWVDTFTDGVTFRSFYCAVYASAGITAGQIIFEATNNITKTPVIMSVYDDSVITGTTIQASIGIAANSNRYFSAKITYRYIRCRISTGFTGGTIQAITRFSLGEYIPRVTTIGQASGGKFSTTVSASLPSGAAAIGDVGIQLRANATGAASTIHLVSAATTNATIVKVGAGRVVGWCISNLSASWKYVKLHNQSTLPTAGAGVVRTIAIPPNSINNFHIVQGIAFTTGIGFTTVTGIEDTDNNPVSLSDLSIDIFYA